MHTSSTPSLRTIRVELFLREDSSAAAVDRLNDLAARVRRLENLDEVAEVEIKTWTTVRPALEALGDAGPSVSATVATFRSWADRAGYSLAPAFAECETGSLLGCDSSTELRVPLASLAISEGEELCCVVPCVDDKRSYSVEDCLAALEEGVIEPASGCEVSLQYRESDAIEEPIEPSE